MSDPFIRSAQFGEHGGPGLQGMWIDAHYEETWMLRAAEITFSNIHVDEDGTIRAAVSVDDTLDLRPDWVNRSLEYNIITTVTGFFWHDLMGATDDMEVQATWGITIPPRQEGVNGR